MHMKKIYESKLGKSITVLAMACVFIIMAAITVYASEEIKINTLYEIIQETNVYEQADENGAVYGAEEIRKYMGNCYCIADSFDFYSRNCINSKEEQS